MQYRLSEGQVRFLRLRAQRLDRRSPESAADVAGIAKEMCGLQAQDLAAAALAVRARSTGLAARDVDRARVDERSVVRTWCMRGTLHLLATEDLGWLLPLLGPVFIRESERRYAELGLDESTRANSTRALRGVLESYGPLTRAEIVQRLAALGVALEGQAVPHLLRYAALVGTICLGPDRHGEPTYVILRDWVNCGPALAPDEAPAVLAQRYLFAYGPAAPDDLAAWSGLPMSVVRTAWQRIAGQLLRVECAGRPVWLLASRAGWLDEVPPRSRLVSLLPSFDAYLLGYRDRDLVVAPEHARRIHPGGGWLSPTLLVDGSAAGVWKANRQRDHLEVAIEPFRDLPEDAKQGLEAEAEDLARFLEVKVRYSVLPPTPADTNR